MMLQRSCGRSWMETCRLKPSPLNCSVLGSSSRQPPLTHSSTATAWGTGVQGRGPDELSLYNAHMGCGPEHFFHGPPSYRLFTIPWKRRALSGRAGERLASCLDCSGHMRPPPLLFSQSSPNLLSNAGQFGSTTVQRVALCSVPRSSDWL